MTSSRNPLRTAVRRAQAAAALAVAPAADRRGGSALVDLGIRVERCARAPGDGARRGVAAVLGRASAPVHWHDGGSGKPLLLLNGWTASGLLWPSDWLADLEQRHRVLRMDNRGAGWSRSAPAPFTVADLADDAAAVLRAGGVESAIVLGFSMGGMVAQELALRHPDLVTGLVLVGTRPPAAAHVPGDRHTLAVAMRPPAPGQSLADHVRATWSVLAAPGFAATHPEVLDELVDQVVRRPTPYAGVLAQIRAVAGWHGAHRCGHIAVPTVVLHGTRDPLMPVGNGMRLARLIPGAKYVELPGVGHLVIHEAPNAVREALTTLGHRTAAAPLRRTGGVA
ncbi:alpha/beta hydrolase [Sporichthya polymorpha]|uniref:alpha/beta hydrolase n=1 Tax=Sporichthya polymorpha TaxID=35751 RepID=UPI00036D6CBB|nr:alpha/beta fold hydrolase [Sporichthya polymorpha]